MNSPGLFAGLALVSASQRCSSVGLSGATTQVRPGMVPDPDQRSRSSRAG